MKQFNYFWPRQTFAHIVGFDTVFKEDKAEISVELIEHPELIHCSPSKNSSAEDTLGQETLGKVDIFNHCNFKVYWCIHLENKL